MGRFYKTQKSLYNRWDIKIHYESASKIVTKNFQGQEFGTGSRKISVQKVDLWQKDGKMIIALDVLGSINGTIYLSGIPNYN